MLLNSVWPVSWSLLFPSQEVLLKLRGDGIDERHIPKLTVAPAVPFSAPMPPVTADRI